MRFFILLLSFLLTGCFSLAPDQTPPKPPIAPTFANVSSKSDGNVTTLPWKHFIQEPRLQQVVALALRENRNLQKAVFDIEAARATYHIQRSSEYPSLDATIAGSKERTVSGNNKTSLSQSSSATLGMSSYEIDFFGKNRLLSKKELEKFQGIKEAERVVRITLIADTATAWLQMASDQSQLLLAKKTLKSAIRSFEIVQKRVRFGIDTKVSLEDAKSSVEQAKASIARYTTVVAQDKAALELLTGAPVKSSLLPNGLQPKAMDWLSKVPVGLSSDILLQRPDVLEAEDNLKAANANIGVARAAYFPSITLTARGGLGSNALLGLFNGGTSTIWSFLPTLTLPIFDAGARDATLAYAKAYQKSLLATYEYTIQTAFKEVASALARRATILAQLQAEAAVKKAVAMSYKLYSARYQKGVDSYLNVLVSQRALYSAKETQLDTRLEALTNRITLYRVLGGGLAVLAKKRK